MILPLSAVWLMAHGAYRALGFRSRLLRAGEHKAHLYERKGKGAGPPVLLVHGMGGNAAGFLPIVRAVLRGSRRVVVVELPGHGRARLLPGQRAATMRECGQAVALALLLRAVRIGGNSTSNTICATSGCWMRPIYARFLQARPSRGSGCAGGPRR